MTFGLNLANITNSIATISVTGVTIKDKDEVVGNWTPLPNVLYPNPNNWISDFEIGYVTNLRGSTAKADISYTLNYRFLGTQSGDLATFPVALSALVDKVILIINAIFAVHAPYSGKVDMELVGISSPGPLPDPAGNLFFGCDIALRITEQQN